MAFTATVNVQHTLQERNTYGVNGQITALRNIAIQQNSCEREHGQVHKVSADLSAHELNINPLGVCAASLAMLLFVPDHPVDLRIGAASLDPLSACRFALFAGTISSVFVTTGSQVTTIRTILTGGSNVSFEITPPMPS